MALTFPASGDKLTTPTFVVPTAITYAAWIINPDFVSSTGPRIFENTTPTTRWFLDGTNSQFVFQRLYGNTAEWRAPFPGGIDWTQWHHIAVTHDASSVNNDPVFYCDGAIVTTSELVTPTGSVNTTTNVMTVANRGTNARQIGTVDHVGIYNAVLSQANIQSLATTAHFASNQFANWSFGSLAATYTDLSGGGRTATVAGSPTFTAGPSLAANQIVINTSYTVTANPMLVIPIGVSIADQFTATLDVTTGTPYPGGLSAGVGGFSKRKFVILNKRRRG